MKKSKYIDHTLLRPDAREEDIRRLCAEAIKNDFASVCVNSFWIPLAHSLLKDTDVKICSVVGFPLGATPTRVKAFEAQDAVFNGANEIDMVMNIGQLKDGKTTYIIDEIKTIKNTIAPRTLKVIIETCLLTKEEIEIASKLVRLAGADFVKTSTGFSTGGATEEDVRLIREAVGPEMGVKASGGIKTPEQFKAMIEAGANRIGTSNGVKLISD